LIILEDTMSKSPIGIKGATCVIFLATLVAIIGAIIFVVVNKDDLAGVWRPHNVVLLGMITIIIPIACICSPIAGAIQAACCWRSVDERNHPGLAQSQRAQKRRKICTRMYRRMHMWSLDLWGGDSS